MYIWIACFLFKDIHKVYRLKRDKKEKSKSKYINRKVLHGIDLMVEEGEVFGLLGHNGKLSD